jgi:hypothetical protein
MGDVIEDRGGVIEDKEAYSKEIDLWSSIFKPNDDDVYLEYYSGKGFHINYSSYVKHINSSNKA